MYPILCNLVLIISFKTSVISSSLIFDLEVPIYGSDENEITYDDYRTEDNSISRLFQNDFEAWKNKREKLSEPSDEDSLPTPQMIESYGYVAETHKVTTEDGYINSLHRIPPRSNVF